MLRNDRIDVAIFKRKFKHFKPCQPSVAFHMESANQMTVSYMKCNTVLSEKCPHLEFF